MHKLTLGAAMAAALIPFASAARAADADVEALRREIQTMRQTYEGRITDLESKLNELEKVSPQPVTAATSSGGAAATSSVSGAGGRASGDTAFNPAIGLILNGRFSAFSKDSSSFGGFAVGEEGERGKESFAIDESELNFSASVDDKFAGSLTVAIVREDGADKIELEEAYVKSLPGLGLPDGLGLKFGRALWTFGALNEHHAHTDSFADRSLPYRAFLNNAFNDDGIEASWVLPTDLYSEVGVGAFRGDDYPFGSTDGAKLGGWSAFGRIGGDIGPRQNWRLGGYVLSGTTDSRSTGEDAVIFAGDSRLYAVDLRYAWAPTGNAREQELSLLGEYMWRKEDGTYDDTGLGSGPIPYERNASGWYVQAVYKFLPQWRAGLRYSRLDAPAVPAALIGGVLDANGKNPSAQAAMLDWSNSEFSRFRLQYNHETLSSGQDDNQVILQYIMSIGAHGAHMF